MVNVDQFANWLNLSPKSHFLKPFSVMTLPKDTKKIQLEMEIGSISYDLGNKRAEKYFDITAIEVYRLGLIGQNNVKIWVAIFVLAIITLYLGIRFTAKAKSLDLL